MRIAVAAAAVLFLLCLGGGGGASTQSEAQVSEVGRVKSKSLVEASGLTRSHYDDELFWTHNDGDDNHLHAIRRDGTVVGRVKVDAKLHDFEDLALDAIGNLYLADTGNNSRDRKRVSVYRIAEPNPKTKDAAQVAQEWRLTFPEKPFDCEALFIWKDHGYLISKVEDGQRASVYRFSLSPGKGRRTLEHVVTLPVNEPVTAADLSDDGRRLAVLSRGSMRVFEMNGEIKDLAESVPKRYALPPIQTEGCCFVPGGVLVIAETGELLLVRETDASTTRPASGAAK